MILGTWSTDLNGSNAAVFCVPVLALDVMSQSLSMKCIARAPNFALQRTGTHIVLGRGRPGTTRGLPPRARVLMRWRAVAELGS